RAPRLAGVEAALDLMTSGAPISADMAQAAGLVDEIADGDLDSAALAYAKRLVAAGAGCRRTRDIAVPTPAPGVFDRYRKNLASRARGLVAPQKIVDCVEAATERSFEEGLAIERKAFLACMASPQSAGLRHLFFAEREAARVVGLPQGTPEREVRNVGVIGAGTMGSGIAMNFASAGFDVLLLERDDDALSRGLGTIARNYAEGVRRGKTDEADAACSRERIKGTTSYEDLADADLIIEAVYESLALKQDVFALLDSVARKGAILATNTSYQDVNEIAAVTRRAEDVLGLHFFSPAHIMKLLEVVRADKTSNEVLATCLSIAKKIRKVPVVAGVCYGFIGNRMLQHYGREAQLCLIEGATPDSIDAAMEEWGMAMGPMRVFDLAGLDVGYKARQGLAPAARGEPRTFRIADALVEAGRLGQKSGAGFYRYDPETRARSVDEGVRAIIEHASAAEGVDRRTIDAGEIVDRLVYALINEGFRIVEEGIAQRPGDIDVVYVYGYGFPAWRGGPMFHADTVGLERVHARIMEFRERFGARYWTPAPLLETLVREGRTLADWQPRPVTGHR
ncbi:MAG TPA: 3-hydroxyacyl-CoA dehydrogenase NAD-binding domain-containing protein, partial [Woeseiaceae bacterium]|nr:3-hydroxyacyl-CoA dehydrogenase NAD-binding domain-containing protein [Woeseiaceae bacterium]